MFSKVPPIVKNAVLAFVAGAVVSFSGFVAANPGNPGRAALLAAGSAAVYAGFRAAVGYIKVGVSGAPFSVDTEAPK